MGEYFPAKILVATERADVSDPACFVFGAPPAPGIFFLGPAPAPGDIVFLQIFLSVQICLTSTGNTCI